MTALALLAVAGNVVQYARFSTLRSLVTVGGHTISKREYLAVLEDTSGKQVLNKMVIDELIRQAAAKAGVTPSDTDINQRMAEVQARNPQIAASVPAYKLRALAASDLALENLRIKNVSVSENDIARCYAAHAQLFHQEAQLGTAMFVTNTRTDAQTATHLLEQNIAPEIIAKQPSFHLIGANGYSGNLQSPAHQAVVKSIFRIRTGAIQTFPFDHGFLTVKVYTNTPAGTAPLTQVKDQVTRLAKLEKAVPLQTELLSLYHADKPTFDIDKYSSFFAEFEQGKLK